MDIIINTTMDCLPANSTLLPSQGDWLGNWLIAMGYPTDNPPVGDMLRQCYHLQGTWQVIVPISWQATHNDAMIVAVGEDLELTDEESRCWFEAIAGFLKEDKLYLHYHNAETWLINTQGKPPLISKPASLMRQQSMMPAFDVMDNTLYWQRLMTELQMFMGAHPLNAERVDKPIINGIWVYGSGVFTMNNTKPIISDDDFFICAFPSKIKPFVEGMSIENNAIVLLKNALAFDSLTSLYCDVRWFWNNAAYFTKKTPWFGRLWRRFRNAYQTTNHT